MAQKSAIDRKNSADIENEDIKVYTDNGGGSIIITSLRKLLRKGVGWLFRWARGSSPWVLHLGIMCCALEIPMAVGAGRFDMERWGVFPPASPRQSDLMIINGPITKKMAQRIKILYDQMPEPKYVIAVGECAICGGPFKGSYNVVHGADKVVPVDVYVPGCPPRPEAFLDALIKLREKIKKGEM
ncbi:MAG: NADH-quinone oxidoreductase subunit B [Candidatus Asgardarchaeia archaeon]